MTHFPVKKYHSFSKILLVLTIGILGCDGPGNQQINREVIKKEMEQREIRHILPAEIVEAAHKQGKSIATQAQEMAVIAYQAEAESLDSLSSFVDERTQEKIDSLAKARKAEIRWIPADVARTKAQLSDLERQIWDAYWYNIKNDLPVNDNVQKINEEAYLYTLPLMLDAELRKKFASGEDVARDHDFLGMWSIRLSKKELILRKD